MFDFLLSEEKKMRRHAANWLEVAERVYHYRRDILPAAQVQQLVAASGDLKLRLKEKSDASKLKMAIEKLEDVLHHTGGSIYPSSSLVENVEFFLVAALVILGLRAYFVQPFKIPTNSMWPTYYGMTHELFKPGEQPGALAAAARFVAFGAIRHTAIAPASGEVMVPLTPSGALALEEKPGRIFGLIPTTRKSLTLSVDGSKVSVEMPLEFGHDTLLDDAFGNGNRGDFHALVRRRIAANPRLEFDGRFYWLPIGKTVKAGETILSFDILTGDLLFVERVSYNFIKPSVGQGFVFKTDNIQSPYMTDRSGNQTRAYYIKRLVGGPGDKLEVRVPNFIRDGGNSPMDPPGQLYRNGAPITGADAFKANAEKRGTYPGYTAHGLLDVGQVVEVPANSYMALGDNSPNSADSRYWGFVPEKDVVGKPLFIYYPLSRRWGVAR